MDLKKYQNIAKDDFKIFLTDKAYDMAKQAVSLEEGQDLFLRISIKGGGCSGLQYNLDIDEKINNFDAVCDFNGLLVVSDIFSLQYLSGTTVDYKETLEGAGFKFDNPNARRSCGCGSSFAA